MDNLVVVCAACLIGSHPQCLGSTICACPCQQDDHYVCANCNGIFKKGWSDEEAMAEREKLWGTMPDDQVATVCENCFGILSS